MTRIILRPLRESDSTALSHCVPTGCATLHTGNVFQHRSAPFRVSKDKTTKMDSTWTREPYKPYLRISTSLSHSLLALSQSPYPTITLTVTLTLHDTTRPLTVYIPGGILDPRRHSYRRSHFCLLNTRTGERAERNETVSAVSDKDRRRKITIDPRTDLLTIQAEESATRAFDVSGYDSSLGDGGRIGGKKEQRLEEWWICGTPLSQLRVEEEYEVRVPTGNPDDYFFKWFDWGRGDEVVREHVSGVRRALGLQRFEVTPRMMMWWSWREREDASWEEGDKASIMFVE